MMRTQSCTCLIGKPLGVTMTGAIAFKNFGVSSSIYDGRDATAADIGSLVLSGREVMGVPVALYADIQNCTLWMTTESLLQPVFFIQLDKKNFGSDQMHVLEWVAQNAAKGTPVEVLQVTESESFADGVDEAGIEDTKEQLAP